MTKNAAPLMPGERIVALDIIRGFALLGILVMNISWFAGTNWLPFITGVEIESHWWDTGAQQVRDIFFDGKFNSLFSFLFALGFTIQLGRLQEREPATAKRIYLRRIGLLFIIGWLHGCLLWMGDVLHIYAALGLLLLLLRNWSYGKLLGLAAFFIAYPGLRSTYLILFAEPDRFARRLVVLKELFQSEDAVYGHGTYLDTITVHTDWMISFYSNPAWTSAAILNYFLLATTMLLGLIAGRSGWIQNAAKNIALTKKVQWLSLAVGISSAIVSVVAMTIVEPMQPSPLWIVYWISYGLARVGIMLFYVATIVRLAQIDRWRNWLMPFAAAGRMPLTNYLMQSVIGTFIFYGWGLGYWRQSGAAVELGLAFGIFFLIQVPLSLWWFRHFDYGPMERLWRWLSYGPRRIRAARNDVVTEQP